MPRVALHTLGCKANQYETQKIAEGFRSRGFDLVDFSEQADVYVINTCTVTHTADSKSRQAARSAIRRNREATVVLTGCYAETSRDRAQAIEGVGLVIGNREKDRLVERVVSLLPGADDRRTGADTPGRNRAATRTRALLKIQDGCDQYCSYCAVPFARPVMESRSYEEVLAEGMSLADRGFKEIVLTGIRLGAYRHDGRRLTDQLRALSDHPGIARLRLSSIELSDIPDGLLDLMESERKVCRHLHIPLQSGADSLLARMNRPYGAADYAAFVREARARVPGIAITTDIMVGFPGETDDEFERTFQLARELRFARTHVFRYSARPGTAAARMDGEVSSEVKERRSARLMKLASESADEFARTLIGGVSPVLIESRRRDSSIGSGLTDNYVRVLVHGGNAPVGELVNVRVESVSQGTTSGSVVE